MTDTITPEQAIDFAKKAGFKACVGTICKEGNYHPFVNALGKDIPIEWVVQLCNLVALAQQAEQAGWVRVPVEPTTKMLDAMTSAWLVGATADMALREYKAMLAAAPKG